MLLELQKGEGVRGRGRRVVLGGRFGEIAGTFFESDKEIINKLKILRMV